MKALHLGILSAGVLTLFLLAQESPEGNAEEEAVPFPFCFEVPSPGGERAVGDVGRLWYKRRLTIEFLDGDDWHHAKVEEYAKEWEPHCGIRFAFGVESGGDVRISFDPRGGNWSLLGTEAEASDGASMNLAIHRSSRESYLKSTILHEFGHALGLYHEHQNPEKRFQWNEQAVIEDCKRIGWTDERIQKNILRSLTNPTLTLHPSEFDRESVMLYPIPARWTNGAFTSSWNTGLSELDKKTVAELYGVSSR
ncbi:MAG: M12 family metallopeptidase [Verrucomicrobiota bacterium]